MHPKKAQLGQMINELMESDVDALLDAYHCGGDVIAAAKQVADMALCIAATAADPTLSYQTNEHGGDRYVSTTKSL